MAEQQQQADEYVRKGTASEENAPAEWQDRLDEVRTHIIHNGGDEYTLIVAHREGEDDKEGHLLEIPTNGGEVTELVTDWLGGETASKVISNIAREGKAHLYVPRVRAEVLALYSQELTEAPVTDITPYFPKGNGSGFFRMGKEQLIARNKGEAMLELLETDDDPTVASVAAKARSFFQDAGLLPKSDA